MKIEFDSNEEELFYYWCKKLIEEGFIKKIELQFPINVIDKKNIKVNKIKKKEVKEEELFFMHSLTYTGDFKITWTKEGLRYLCVTRDLPVKFKGAFSSLLKTKFLAAREEGEYVSYIDIKPSYSHHKNTTSIKFPLLQKIIYDKCDIYVQKVMPLHKNGIFANTFTPQKAWYTAKTKKPKSYLFTKIHFNDFFKKLKNE